MRFNNLQDLLAGLLFAAFGAAALWFGQSLALGAATRMGPGYLPTILGWLLIGLGGVIVVRSFLVNGVPIQKIHLRPQIMIIAALIAFALLVERFGLLAAAAAAVVLGSLGSREARPLETVVLAVVTALASVGLFIYLLGQPMVPWNWGL